MSDDIKLPEPAGYFYEWNSFGLRRSFNYWERNGAIPTSTVQFFTADQLRAAVMADREVRAYINRKPAHSPGKMAA